MGKIKDICSSVTQQDHSSEVWHPGENIAILQYKSPPEFFMRALQV